MKKPTFETGKTYRTRSGQTALISFINDAGNYPLRGWAEGHPHCWTKAGAWDCSGIECSLDLLPGAIEDENRTAEGIAAGQDDGRTAISHPATLTDPGHPGHMPVADKLDIDTLDRLDAAVTDLFRQVRNLRRRASAEEKEGQERDKQIAALSDRVTAIYESVLTKFDRQDERMATEARANGLALRMDSIDERLAKLENTDAEQIVARITHGGGFSVVFPPKRTIKGGWVNVYHGPDDSRQTLGPVHDDPESARIWRERDGREHYIACIHIPDITEGEGL